MALCRPTNFLRKVITAHTIALGVVGLTSEEMRAGFPELDGLVIELASTAVRVGHDPLPHGLYPMFAVWVEKDDNGVPLRVV